MSGKRTSASTRAMEAYLSAARSAYERDRREKKAERYGLDRVMSINFRLGVLFMCEWNRSLAAFELGITSRALRYTITEARTFGMHIPMPARDVMRVLPPERRQALINWVHKIDMFKICRELKDDYDRQQGNDNQNR